MLRSPLFTISPTGGGGGGGLRDVLLVNFRSKGNIAIFHNASDLPRRMRASENY